MALLGTFSTAPALTETFNTPTGQTEGGLPVDATVTFITSPNTVTFVVTDLQNNPTDIVQSISAVGFIVDGINVTGTLASSTGEEVTIAANGSSTVGPTASTGWLLSNSGYTYEVDDLTGTGPIKTVIGPATGGDYVGADPTIAGSATNNPFLNETASFTVTLAGVTSQTDISSAGFQFGTTEGQHIIGGIEDPTCGCPTTPSVPEPSTWAMLFGGLGVMAFIRLRRTQV